MAPTALHHPRVAVPDGGDCDSGGFCRTAPRAGGGGRTLSAFAKVGAAAGEVLGSRLGAGGGGGVTHEQYK